MSSKTYENIIEQISALTVLELSELVKALEEKFGVSAAMPAMAAASSDAPEAKKQEEEKSEYKVELVDGGPEKIKSIKALRTVSTFALTEAKALVENGGVIAEAASKEDANKIKDAMEAAGAKVKLS